MAYSEYPFHFDATCILSQATNSVSGIVPALTDAIIHAPSTTAAPSHAKPATSQGSWGRKSLKITAEE